MEIDLGIYEKVMNKKGLLCISGERMAYSVRVLAVL